MSICCVNILLQCETVRIGQTKNTVTNLLLLYTFTQKKKKKKKSQQNNENWTNQYYHSSYYSFFHSRFLYIDFFFFTNMYNICHFLYVYNISLQSKYIKIINK